MRSSRIKNVSRNMVFGLILKIYQILTPFIIRTVMIYFMGVEYLGLNSLFTSILQVLNLAELGVGSAMVFSMYEPIARDDHITVCALMKLYKIYYRIIGLIILVAGFLIMPFIPQLISGEIPGGLNVFILYFLNLITTVFSYWLFAYKNCLLTAFQRNDVISKSLLIASSVQYCFQILVLIFWKDYYIYLMIALLAQILNNVLTAYKAGKLYPQYQPKGKLDRNDVKQINGKVKDLFTAKVGGVIVNSVDTIVISAFLGLTVLAIYQNYYYILSAVMGINQVIYKACLASIGNSMVMESQEKNFLDFTKISMLYFWAIGFCVVCFACLFQPFMKMWVGEHLMLDYSMVIMFCIYFYVFELMSLFSMYKDAAGIWHQDRYRPLVEAASNLVMNLIMVQFIGLYGILLSTILSMACISLPWLYKNLFSYVFNRKSNEYSRILLKGTLIILGVSLGTAYLCNFIPYSVVGLILRIIICLIPANLLFLAFFRRLDGFSEVLILINTVLGKNLFKTGKN